jgi:NTP pyrophosphatase (non-canonical NTP hydrolase)
MSGIQHEALRRVLEERTRQDYRFGSPPQNLTPSAWLTILMEEMGEVAKATIDGNSTNYIEELVQVAAVALYALEDAIGGCTPYRDIQDDCPPIQYEDFRS